MSQGYMSNGLWIALYVFLGLMIAAGIALLIISVVKKVIKDIIAAVLIMIIAAGSLVYLITAAPDLRTEEGKRDYISELDSLLNEPGTAISYTYDDLTNTVRQYIAKHGYINWTEEVYLSALAEHLSENLNDLPSQNDLAKCLKEAIPPATDKQAQEAAKILYDKCFSIFSEATL